jgi:hypothetical protein
MTNTYFAKASKIERMKNGKQKYTAEIKSRSVWDATAPNEHIAKIAALPRGINILLFSRAGSR